MSGKYYFDLVVCFECGNDMLARAPMLREQTKKFIRAAAISVEAASSGEEELEARVKFVGYGGRSYTDTVESDFVDALEEWDFAESFLASVAFSGLCGNPAAALKQAIASPWVEDRTTRRRQVVLFVGRGDEVSTYAINADIEAELAELYPVWEGSVKLEGASFDYKRARLISLSDGIYPWRSMLEWNRFVQIKELPHRASDELAEAMAMAALY